MRRVLVILAVFAAFAMTACGEPELKTGTVVNKEYVPESQGMYFVPLQAGQTCSGNPSICTPIYIQMPYYYTDPERWVLKMKDGDKKGSFYVSEDMYNRINIGDTIDAGGGVNTKAPERIRGGRAD